MILLSVNALLSDGHLSPHNSGLEALIKAIFFHKGLWLRTTFCRKK